MVWGAIVFSGEYECSVGRSCVWSSGYTQGIDWGFYCGKDDTGGTMRGSTPTAAPTHHAVAPYQSCGESTVNTLESCQAACTADPDCSGVEFLRDQPLYMPGNASYCAWWAVGKCTCDDTRVHLSSGDRYGVRSVTCRNSGGERVLASRAHSLA